jgi:hypothetical protein
VRRLSGIAIALCLAGGGLVLTSLPVAAAVTCPSVNPVTKAVTPAPAPGVNWNHCNLAGANLAGANLAGANLYGADLTGADLAGTDLTGTLLHSAVLTGTNLAGAVLTTKTNIVFVRSGGITGTPASLPAHWQLINGYLIGPLADLIGANLAGINWAGVNLTSVLLDSANLTGSDLAGANLSYAGLTGANLTSANLTNANLTGVNLANANLTGADLTGANFVMAHWSNTTCPDGSNSDKHQHGCTTPLDTTPPVVTVFGAVNGEQFILGEGPNPTCTTTDDGTVVTPATLTLTTTGINGTGVFTATCSGAVDLAGNKAAPVSATYTVVYGFGGYISPSAGGTIARSSRTVTVRFRLTNVLSAPIAPPVAAALASAGGVRVTLAGPHIRAVTVGCGWHQAKIAANRYFQCVIHLPGGIRPGKAFRYTITAQENPRTGFTLAPPAGAAINPVVIHFR